MNGRLFLVAAALLAASGVALGTQLTALPIGSSRSAMSKMPPNESSGSKREFDINSTTPSD